MKPQLRNSNVYFDALTHTYLRESDDKVLKGITGTLIRRAFPTTYDDIPESVLQHAAARGTYCHNAIEAHVEGNGFDDALIDVVTEADKLLKSRNLSVIAIEYIVSDQENYATAIDLLCMDKNGNLYIVDIKTTSTKMYEHVQLQTSIDKMFFELQNPDLKIKGLMCMWIKVNDDWDVLDSDLFELEPVADEYISNLISCDLADEPFSIEKFYGNLPAKVGEVENYLHELDILVKEKTSEYKMIKEGLLKLMIENNVKSFDSGHTKLTRVFPQKRVSFDEERFKADHPDIYKEYQTKVATTKDSIRITYR